MLTFGCCVALELFWSSQPRNLIFISHMTVGLFGMVAVVGIVGHLSMIKV